jgi:hypothetical protein
MSKARDLADYISSGNVDATELEYLDGVTSDIQTQLDGKQATGDYIVATGDTMTGNLSFGDYYKAIFGDSSDLEIFHAGTNSVVRDVGAGNLSLQSNGEEVNIWDNANNQLMAQFITGGAVSLRHNGDVKLATTSTGIDVTGELIADSYNESYIAVSGTDIDCEAGNVFSKTISANTTFTFSNPPASGTAYGFTFKLTVSGTRTVTWPSAVDWAGGTAPDAPASGETDVYVFFTHDGGTTWYGAQAIDAAG